MGPGRLGPAGRPGGRDPGHPVAHRRSRAPRTDARRGGLSRGRHPERRRVPASWPALDGTRAGADGHTATTGSPPGSPPDRRLPVPGHRRLAGRARPADRGAEPGPADHADPRRGRRPRPDPRAARGHRPALAGDRPRRAGLDRGRPDRVDPGRPGHPPPGAAGPGPGAGSVTPPGLQVRGVLDVDGDTVLFQASPEPAEVGLWSYGPAGLQPRRAGRRRGRRHPRRRHHGQLAPGPGRRRRDRPCAPRRRRAIVIASLAEPPALPAPRPVLFRAGPREIQTAVLFPSWHQPGRQAAGAARPVRRPARAAGAQGPAPTWSRSGSPSRVSR